MTLLIAGFGDLGLAIAKQAAQDPKWQTESILALKRSKPDLTGLPHVSWLAADLANPVSVEGALANAMHALPKQTRNNESITHVVYCAAPNERTEAAYRATYLTGLQNLVGALDKTRLPQQTGTSAQTEPPHILFVSSTAVYDSQAQGVFDETSPTEPRAFNGRILCESEAWLLSQCPKATILRLSGIYGPTKQRLLQSIVAGTSTVPDSNEYLANRIHLDDAARAVLHLLVGRCSGVFVGTDSCPMPLATLYSSLAQMLGAPAPKTGDVSPMMGKKRLSNQKLLDTGFELKWPDSIAGYQAIVDAQSEGQDRS
jgi:nucleoside-diphosphate-sugar epimerase